MTSNGQLHKIQRMWKLRKKIYYRMLDTDAALTLGTALLVGIGAGFGAVIFRRLIESIHQFSFSDVPSFLGLDFPLHLLLMPALGGLVVGPLVYYYAREAKGHGVPEVMEALELRGGIIRPRVVLIKALASSVCIGTGGSVGREGPIAQIGSAIGSVVGQVLKLPKERIRTLVACGAAGGVAATFNAPIAGAIFALEVLLRRFGSLYFGAVVISAVTADVIAHYFEGDQRAFLVPDYSLISGWELLFYTLLGLLSAAGGVIFYRLLYYSEDAWARLRFPEPLKPVLGGIILGMVGIYTFQLDGVPRIFGVGYSTIEEALSGNMMLEMALALLVLKLFSTTLTLGSGGSGGIFAPSLFMGAMLGCGYGHLVHSLFPGFTAPAGAYALVGMAAFFSGAAHAPITAVFILFEMTGQYEIIMPLMITSVISTLISRGFSRDSIYTLKLKRRGVVLQQDQHDIDLMQGIFAGEAMNRYPETVTMDMPLDHLMEEFARTHYQALPVVDAQKRLNGIVNIRSMDQLQVQEGLDEKTVSDIADILDLPSVLSNDPLWMVLRHLEEHGGGCVPVIKSDKDPKLLGVLRRIDIIRAYNKVITRKASQQHQEEMLTLRHLNQAGLMQVQISKKSPLVGMKVRELELGEDSLLVSIRRRNKLRVVRGDTVLQAEDQVMIFAEHPRESQLRERLNGNNIVPEGSSETIPVKHREVVIPSGKGASGMLVKDLNLPENCVLVRILRGEEVILPRGNTRLQGEDSVEIVGHEAQLLQAESCLAA